ncbi:TIGR02677 family protein, partial [Saccharopolyspora sp. NPDC047091]
MAHQTTETRPTGPFTNNPAPLCSGGRVEKFGSTGKVRDVAQLAALRAARARQERTELDAAWQRVA